MKRSLLLVAVALVMGVSSSCLSGCSSVPSTPNLGAGTFAVLVTSVNGGPLPTVQNPMRPTISNADTTTAMGDNWAFSIEAHSPTGELDTSFDGFVGLTLAPGTVVAVTGTGARGRNILLAGGKASGVVEVTNVYGPTNLWVEDLGYVPAPTGTVPECSNGIDDNHNGLIDYPADPGCYYADDNTEDGGTYAAGVSPAVQYRLPAVADVRGRVTTPFPTSATLSCPSSTPCSMISGIVPNSPSCCVDGSGTCMCSSGGASTPYQNEAIEIATQSPAYLVVTALATDGFYVTDLNPTAVEGGYNSLFAYNFTVPEGMAICDRVTSLAGTSNDFYGATQLSFPSFENTYTLGPNGFDLDCRIPDPIEIGAAYFTGEKNTTSANLFPIESALVGLTNYTIAANFGAKLATGNQFLLDQSNCDFNGDGQIDYTALAPPDCPPGECEGACANACDNDAGCSEWTAYSARNEVKVSLHGAPGLMCTNVPCILVDTSTLDTFDPVGNAGKTLPHVTGNLTEFSGGNLNWTVVARCDDDVACPAAWGCTTQSPISSTSACLALHTASDNDEGTN